MTGLYHAGMHAFVKFLDVLFPPRNTELLIRDAPLDALVSKLRPHMTGSATFLLSYTDPLVHAAIIEAKYHGNQHATKLLAHVLSGYLKHEVSPEVILVPIPLSEKRRKDRGYNQVEEICRGVNSETDTPYTILPDILMRVRDTIPQTTLSKEQRRENMRGAFRADRELDRSRTYVVIDDVTTTGATLHAAHDALTDVGAASILLVALAH